MFQSLLYRDTDTKQTTIPESSAILKDLGLNDLFNSIDELSGYPTKKFDLTVLNSDQDIKFRQDVFVDLQNKSIFQALEKFLDEMLSSYDDRQNIPRIDPEEYKEHVLVDLLERQLTTIEELLNSIDKSQLHSVALTDFFQYLKDYQKSDKIKHLRRELTEIDERFEDISYRLLVNGRNITVQALPQPKESLDSRFDQLFNPLFDDPFAITQPVKLKQSSPSYNMNNLQTSIITKLTKLYPDQFTLLKNFYEKYAEYADTTIKQAVDELTFYIGWQKVENQLREKLGVSFVIPEMIDQGSESVQNSFDLGMAAKKIQEHDEYPVITNDFEIKSDKPFLVISGPNQGGKTTYARMVGQFYFLEKLGLPIPGTDAHLQTKAELFSHFDRQESSKELSGLLEIDVERIHDIIEKVDNNSFVILNELFSSTSEEDATELGNRVLNELLDRGVKGIYVTFLESLGEHPGVQPLMSQVTEDAKRTFKIIPQDLNGKAYTAILLQKYQLSADEIEGRVQK